MIDRERLIMAWEIFRDINPYEICNGREFRTIKEPEYCMGQMIEDTITLLKEQEEEIENLKQTAQSMMEGICLLKEQEAATVESIQMDRNDKWGADLTGYCPSCKRPLKNRFNQRFCGECGQAVKWDG